MPFPAAIGAAITAAASTVTVAGLATGAAIISAGTGILSQVTGSKTLGKISMGFGIASGAGFLTSGMSSMGKMNPSTTSSGKGLLQTNNIDDMLKAPTKGTKAADSGFKQFSASGAQTSSADSFAKNANAIGGNVQAPAFDPQIEKSFFERANDTLTKYNPMLNLAAGMGQGYMMNENMELQKDLLDKRLNIDQQLIDRTNRNNGTLMNFDPALNLSRTENPFPLLRR